MPDPRWVRAIESGFAPDRMERLQYELGLLQRELERLYRERDEARSEVEALRERLWTLEQKVAKAREALLECKGLFAAISLDWTDPRAECSEGLAVVKEALAALDGQGGGEGLA